MSEQTTAATEPKRKHKATRVTVGDTSEDIDAAIAPLVRALWKSGVETTMSCQCDGWGYVWIEFPTQGDVVSFLNAVGRFEPGRNSMYARMGQWWRSDDPDRDWVYEVHPSDWAYDICAAEDPNSEAHAGEPDFDFTFSVRLPQCDLGTVTKRMKAHARRLGVAGVKQ